LPALVSEIVNVTLRPESRALDLIVVGGSMGALRPIEGVLRDLRLRAPLAVVLHVSENHRGILPRLLGELCAMPVLVPCDKERIDHGTVYFAPAGYHLLVESGGGFALSTGPRVCSCRPSIDVLFQSASAVYGRSLAAVVLSGANADGAAGASFVRRAGGIVLVQDPNEAEAPQMPHAVLSTGPVDFVGSVSEIRSILERMGRCHERYPSSQHPRGR
jgi:two-component system chemotaxis response regulator CheB